MAAALLSDALWDLVEPFLPSPPRRPKGGRPRRRLRDWQLTGVWDLIHFALLDWLARQDQVAKVCADLLARSPEDLSDWVAVAHHCRCAFP